MIKMKDKTNTTVKHETVDDTIKICKCSTTDKIINTLDEAITIIKNDESDTITNSVKSSSIDNHTKHIDYKEEDKKMQKYEMPPFGYKTETSDFKIKLSSADDFSFTIPVDKED